MSQKLLHAGWTGRTGWKLRDSGGRSSVCEQRESFGWAGGTAEVSMGGVECGCAVSPLEQSTIKNT